MYMHKEFMNLHFVTQQINVYHYVHRALLKAAVIVVPILGCTWVFGVLAVNEDTVVFAWIFTIFNSLQVTYLFCYYILV